MNLSEAIQSARDSLKVTAHQRLFIMRIGDLYKVAFPPYTMEDRPSAIVWRDGGVDKFADNG